MKELFIKSTLLEMKLSEAIVDGLKTKNGWCIQLVGCDPQLIDSEAAFSITFGFKLGIWHYQKYMTMMREVKQDMQDEIDAGCGIRDKTFDGIVD